MSRDPLVNIVAAGLDTGTAQKALDAGWNLTKLRAATKKELEEKKEKRKKRTRLDSSRVLFLFSFCSHCPS
jgi:hypothetical protein